MDGTTADDSPDMSCRTAVTSDPDKEEDVGVVRGCGMLPGETTVSSLTLLLAGKSAMSMWCLGGETGRGEEGSSGGGLGSTSCAQYDSQFMSTRIVLQTNSK